MTEAPRLHLVGDSTASLFAPFLTSWVIKLEAENKSPDTITGYMYSLQDYVRWTDATHGISDPTEITTRRCREWLADQLVKNSPATAKSRWTGMRSFCKFMDEEGELSPSPMAVVVSPNVPDKPAEMITIEQVGQLLKGCEGPTLVDRRDVALISLYADTGGRLAELARVEKADMDLRAREVTVLGKGSVVRILPFGARTARAVDRYIRIRDRQPYAHLPNLWLSGKDGKAMSKNGIQQMFRRRGKSILKIDNLHPHMMRHLFADLWLKDDDAKEGDLMQLTGWKSRQMLTRYAAKTRAERAREAYRTRSPMDRI